MSFDSSIIKRAMACRCPKCDIGKLYKEGLTLDLQDHCTNCGLDFTKNDSADGPAVFLIFVLGFMLVPLALLLEVIVEPPLWVHGVLWSVIALALTIGSLKPLKSIVIHLQFKHRPGDWD